MRSFMNSYDPRARATFDVMQHQSAALQCTACHSVSIGAKPRSRYTEPELLAKPCTLVHLRSRSRYTIQAPKCKLSAVATSKYMQTCMGLRSLVLTLHFRTSLTPASDLTGYHWQGHSLHCHVCTATVYQADVKMASAHSSCTLCISVHYSIFSNIASKGSSIVRTLLDRND